MNNDLILHTTNQTEGNSGSGIIASQTPIEIALGIDEAGMTTASKLYEFLELNPSNYAKWFRTNITNNKFAEENVDFTRFVLKYESASGIVKERQDAKLTATFAKKLSMLTKSEKGEEARNYFLGTEEALKQVTIRRNNELIQLKAQAYDLAAENKVLSQKVEKLEQRQNEIEDKLSHGFSDNDREVMVECLTKLAGVLAVPVQQDSHSSAPGDLLLTEKQLNSIRSSVRVCVERQMKWIESNEFVLPPKSKSGVQSIIRMNIHTAIKEKIGVRHTQAAQSQYNTISKIIWNYKVSPELINRIYRYTQNWVDKGWN